jgi:hypothetical protein
MCISAREGEVNTANKVWSWVQMHLFPFGCIDLTAFSFARERRCTIVRQVGCDIRATLGSCRISCASGMSESTRYLRPLNSIH